MIGPLRNLRPRRLSPSVMGKRNVTSSDVARLAEVSQSAVSRTYTPGASVAPETRARVLDAARKDIPTMQPATDLTDAARKVCAAVG